MNINIFLDLKNAVDEQVLKQHLIKYNNVNAYYSFTPYSSYVYEQLGVKYKYISEQYCPNKYKIDTKELKEEFFKKFPQYRYFKYKFSLLFSMIIQDNFKFKIITQGQYLYITDKKLKYNDINQVLNNEANIFTQYLDSNYIIKLTNINNKKIQKKINLRKRHIAKIFILLVSYLTNMFLKRFSISSFTYDSQYVLTMPYAYTNYFVKNNIKKIFDFNDTQECKFFDLLQYPLAKEYNKIFTEQFAIIDNYKLAFDDKLNKDIVSHNQNCLSSNIDEYHLKKLMYDNKIFVWSYQHGSYLYHTLKDASLEDLYEVEIENSNLNFVFNDYTKKLFEDLGAKKVYSVGSILFNNKIIDRNKEYDYLYITQGHDYMGNAVYVDFNDSMHSIDGQELYQRHKNIIKLFGEKLKDKKIIIRVHPCVVTTGVYVPFWELAEPYPNITIDVSIPIHTLIEKSKYIISDYFTTEFINRELHYKRDIILFQGAPTPLPEETIEDMKKMFILVDTVDDLEDKIKNIETITKNRKRYDDIIEYYSSKKCDTKKVVIEILKKELNGR